MIDTPLFAAIATPEEFVLAQLDDIQRDFILRQHPRLDDQELSREDWEAVEPHVPRWSRDVEEPAVVHSFGDMTCQHECPPWPKLTFRFNEVGLKVRAALVASKEASRG